ncbi:MAG TPA: hypothetical protein VEO74_14565 [Thermoanaerobaculia bacterium]|nr:hypothetical protein [Thermoanaerobaculia bacterium]
MSDLQRLYQEATTPRDRSACPSAETLAGPVSDELVTHLARCSACAREYRITRAFRQLEPRRQQPWLLIAAAVLVLVTAPLIVWNNRLRDEVVRLDAGVAEGARRAPLPVVTRPLPEIGTAIVDLETAVRGTAENTVIDVPKGTSLFTLILHLPEPRTRADLELLDSTGRVTWRGTWSAPRPESSLTVTLSAPAGDYTLRAGTAAFRFRVQHGG